MAHKWETAIACMLILFLAVNIICATTYLPQTQRHTFRDFNSVLELNTFLALNDISQREYSSDTYRCTQFARDLVDAARQYGYRMWCFSIWVNESTVHAMCIAYAGDQLYAIEPQTDNIIIMPGRSGG